MHQTCHFCQEKAEKPEVKALVCGKSLEHFGGETTWAKEHHLQEFRLVRGYVRSLETRVCFFEFVSIYCQIVVVCHFAIHICGHFVDCLSVLVVNLTETLSPTSSYVNES